MTRSFSHTHKHIQSGTYSHTKTWTSNTHANTRTHTHAPLDRHILNSHCHIHIHRETATCSVTSMLSPTQGHILADSHTRSDVSHTYTELPIVIVLHTGSQTHTLSDTQLYAEMFQTQWRTHRPTATQYYVQIHGVTGSYIPHPSSPGLSLSTCLYFYSSISPPCLSFSLPPCYPWGDTKLQLSPTVTLLVLFLYRTLSMYYFLMFDEASFLIFQNFL